MGQAHKGKEIWAGVVQGAVRWAAICPARVQADARGNAMLAKDGLAVFSLVALIRIKIR